MTSCTSQDSPLLTGDCQLKVMMFACSIVPDVTRTTHPGSMSHFAFLSATSLFIIVLIQARKMVSFLCNSKVLLNYRTRNRLGTKPERNLRGTVTTVIPLHDPVESVHNNRKRGKKWRFYPPIVWSLFEVKLLMLKKNLFEMLQTYHANGQHCCQPCIRDHS
jgi:hypothetical protein